MAYRCRIAVAAGDEPVSMPATPTTSLRGEPIEPSTGDLPRSALLTAGRKCWALLGIAGVAVVVMIVASQLVLVLVPVVLALFPATLLAPVTRWLERRGAPQALASALALAAGVLLIAGIIGAMVPLVASELPALTSSAADGMAEIERALEDDPLGIGIEGVSDLFETAREQIGEAGDVAGQAVAAVTIAVETAIGLVLLLVVLFFFLKDGPRIAAGLLSIVPLRHRRRWRRLGVGAWDTLGAYFRGQLLVALIDAVAIGVGLLLLGVPLAIPLSVLIFFGGLFPIVGALVTGTLAVLVALADGGLAVAAVVLVLIVVVQQVESNLLEPLILARVIRLHPLVVLLAITAGGLLLGILGAFLAVPVAAIAARVVDDLRHQPPGGATDPTPPTAATA